MQQFVKNQKVSVYLQQGSNKSSSHLPSHPPTHLSHVCSHCATPPTLLTLSAILVDQKLSSNDLCTWSRVVWCGVVWCGVVWCGVVCWSWLCGYGCGRGCGVVWGGVVVWCWCC